MKDPGTGLSHWRVTRLVPDPSGYSLNGYVTPALEEEVLRFNPVTQAYDRWEYGNTSVAVSRMFECPVDYFEKRTSDGNKHTLVCFRYTPDPEPVCDECDSLPNPVPQKAGNPIYASSGVKEQTEVDYTAVGPGGLRFARVYRSDRGVWEHNYNFVGADMRRIATNEAPTVPHLEPARRGNCIMMKGQSTSRQRCFLPAPSGNINDFALQRGNGQLVRFGSPTGWTAAPNVNDRVTAVESTGGDTIYRVQNSRNDSTETYLNGKLTTIVFRNGQSWQFAYAAWRGKLPSALPALLESVTDHFGLSLRFSYDEEGRLASLTTPENTVIRYGYDESSSRSGKGFNLLTSVTYADGKSRIYWYNEPENTAGVNRPYALTGITDENGKRYATFKYDGWGRAISTEHAGAVEKYSFKLDPISITDPLGATRTYNYRDIFGRRYLVGETQPAGAGSLAASRRVTYDANGNIDAYVDFRGITTKYTYDLTRNLETTRIEAQGTLQERQTSTEWHLVHRLPIRIASPKQITIIEYFDSGEIKSRSVRATSDLTGKLAFGAAFVGSARTVSYTYNAKWQVETTTGPNPGNKTSYAYDPSTGNLATITNALGHVTRFDDYDGAGRVLKLTQPNGVVTRIAYHPRGWVQSVAVTDGATTQTTSYEYDGVGQVTKITAPSGAVINNVYDDAHRLTDVYDSLGNTIHYELDNMGNVTKETVKDPFSALTRQLTRQFDVLNRLKEQTGVAQ